MKAVDQPISTTFVISGDGCRVSVDLHLPRLQDTQLRRVIDSSLAGMPGFRPGDSPEAWAKVRHAALSVELAAGRARFPDATSFSECEDSITINAWEFSGLISVHLKHYEFGAGAGETDFVTLVDATTLAELSLDDLITPADQPRFAQVLTSRWRDLSGLEPEARPSAHGLSVDVLPAVLPLLTPTGAEVIYSRATIGPNSTGTVQVSLPREVILPFLSRDPWIN